MKPHISVCMSAEGVRRFSFVIHISDHYGRTAKTDLSVLSVRDFVTGAYGAYLIICVGIWKSYAGFAFFTIGGKTACRNTFGRSVTLADMNG